MMRSVVWLLLIGLVHSCLAQDDLNLLRDLCNDDSSRIEDVSSVVRLSQIVNSEEWMAAGLPENCIAKYRDPLEKLAELVEDRELSVCSQRSIARISKFHWKYAVAKLSQTWAKNVNNTVTDLPEPLFAFFVDYTMKVSELCMESMFSNLDSAARQDQKEILESLKGKLNYNVNLLKSFIIPQDRVKRFDSFMLYWTTMVTNMMRKGKLDVDTIDENNEILYGIIASGDAKTIWEMQDLCRYELRPIYQDTVYPVMRLVDLGYVARSLDDKRFKDSELVKFWYYITQVCELALGIEYLEDPKLAPGKFVTLDTDERNNAGYTKHAVKPRGEIPSHPGLTAINGPVKLMPTSSRELKSKASKIKWSLKRRNYVLMRLYKNLLANYVRHPISTLKLIMHKGGKSSKKAIDSEGADQQSVKELIEKEKSELDTEEDDEHLDHEGAKALDLDEHLTQVSEEKTLVRRKRDDDDLAGGGTVIFVVCTGFSLSATILFLAILGVIYTIHGPFLVPVHLVVGK